MTIAAPRVRRAIVALGSNVEPDRWVPWAIARLRERFTDTRFSPAYRAEAVGPAGQPPFVNLVVAFRTDLPLPALRAVLRHVEARAGRRRQADRFAPRPLDLDVIALDGPGGGEFLDASETSSPHVLVPWADLEPERELPGEAASLGARAAGLRALLRRVRLDVEDAG